ncbi:hypothetical protein SERLA73DRAFT_185358 [Serpula lacrymans var. lacrymans S7.3]|uniref:Carboxymuconolactone decarboxylase-like domain-containing protein n=2 Tax=Serpula lacrymans var. lacrymans TaxID=341189 RepID=F8Q4M0_SERL3|nr:uncharacterized protein SERLADRAFT_473797 [Serpula lacrymans var. lacrymans S7.9]EGN97075.1 hypothetical protein SERLA73DRAFT_185358 [Serpula lacrymans var. lacrymans S7.3]EGO22677.1 hypothetical protein SERLADRAFT_473797 [Serpula lacrymans var. lacrymans S7.9]
MVDIATPDFLSHLKSLYPEGPSYIRNPWYAVSAIAFSASNQPEAVPLVLRYALNDLDSLLSPQEDRLYLARKIRDMVFKSGMISGFPKVINALGALHSATPEDLRDAQPLRDTSLSTEDITRAGQEFFDQTYGETASTVQPFLRAIYPDLEFYVTSFAYGFGYAFMDVTSPMETSFAMIAALIATDTPRQIEWHLGGALRNGASVAEVKAVRQISIEIAQASGIVWKGDIPDL